MIPTYESRVTGGTRLLALTDEELQRIVLVSSNPTVATVPPSVAFAAGVTTKSFTITTIPVAQSAAVTINATAGGVTTTAGLTVAPPVLSSLTLAPTTITGGTGVNGQVSFSGPAPPGGLVVRLLSNNPAVAALPVSVSVAAGATTASFTVATVKVAQSTAVTITAFAGGGSKAAQLTVTR